MTADTWAILVALAGGLFAVWKALSGQVSDMNKRFGERSGRMEKRFAERSDRMEQRLAGRIDRMGERVSRVEKRITDVLRDFMRDVESMLVRDDRSSVARSESPRKRRNRS